MIGNSVPGPARKLASTVAVGGVAGVSPVPVWRSRGRCGGGSATVVAAGVATGMRPCVRSMISWVAIGRVCGLLAKRKAAIQVPDVQQVPLAVFAHRDNGQLFLRSNLADQIEFGARSGTQVCRNGGRGVDGRQTAAKGAAVGVAVSVAVMVAAGVTTVSVTSRVDVGSAVAVTAGGSNSSTTWLSGITPTVTDMGSVVVVRSGSCSVTVAGTVVVSVLVTTRSRNTSRVTGTLVKTTGTVTSVVSVSTATASVTIVVESVNGSVTVASTVAVVLAVAVAGSVAVTGALLVSDGRIGDPSSLRDRCWQRRGYG